MTDAGFAAELATNLVGEFLATLAPLSEAPQLITQGLQVRMNSTNELKLPARTGSPSAVTTWVEEGEPIAVRQYALNDDCKLSPRKFGFIIGISREAAKRAGGEAVVCQPLLEDGAASLNGAYFSDQAGDDVTHGGMLGDIA